MSFETVPSDNDEGTEARARRDTVEGAIAYGVGTEALMSSPHLPLVYFEPPVSTDEIVVDFLEDIDAA